MEQETLAVRSVRICLFVSTFALALPARADMVIAHVGATDPLDEGWTQGISASMCFSSENGARNGQFTGNSDLKPWGPP